MEYDWREGRKRRRQRKRYRKAKGGRDRDSVGRDGKGEEKENPSKG